MLLALGVCAIPISVTAQLGTGCTSPSPAVCEGHIDLGHGWKLPYYRNRPLSGASVTRAVIVVHGANRKPRDEFSDVMRAAINAGVADHTLVIAPYFQTPADHPAAHDSRWTKNGWKQGDSAIVPTGLSSFTVMDTVLTTLADKGRFPNLTEIVIAGHSAGGQFTQRYAAAGQAPSILHGVDISYLVANASSYLYFNAYRPDPADPTGQHFIIPTTSCAYDNYKYGVGHPNAYLDALVPSAITARYVSRHVTYLLGSADTGQHELDTTCAAKIQGNIRFQRGNYYYNYVRTFFPAAPDSRLIVPGVGHSTRKMFTSTQARTALFPNPHAMDPPPSP